GRGATAAGLRQQSVIPAQHGLSHGAPCFSVPYLRMLADDGQFGLPSACTLHDTVCSKASSFGARIGTLRHGHQCFGRRLQCFASCSSPTRGASSSARAPSSASSPIQLSLVPRFSPRETGRLRPSKRPPRKSPFSSQ